MPPTNSSQACPLCHGRQSTNFYQDQQRPYRRCRVCRLVFVPSVYHLAPPAEKAEYDRHQNRTDDAGYRRFLSRLAGPLGARLASGSRGLDFGSGPGPVLAAMLEAAGHAVSLYDPFYAADPAVLTARYDFVTATEVVEHLRRPGAELERLYRLLKPGGLLGIMTKRVIDRERFARWHYIRDPTHICFFSRETFIWLADRWCARLDIVDRDVIIIEKPAGNQDCGR